MEYVINVAKPIDKNKMCTIWGTHEHYFKVIVPYGSVKKVYEELKEMYPDYKIEVTVWQKVGETIDMDKCNF